MPIQCLNRSAFHANKAVGVFIHNERLFYPINTHLFYLKRADAQRIVNLPLARQAFHSQLQHEIVQSLQTIRIELIPRIAV